MDVSEVSVLAAAWEGLRLVLTWPNVLYPIVGTLAAMCIALLPGVSGAALIAIAIPLTFSWDPLPIMLLFGALVGGATFMGSVTAILLGIPGTAPNAATLFDGHPMALQGRARTAIACSAASSALGSTVGIVILIALIPIMVYIVPLVGPPEYLMLALWGLVSIATVIRASLIKGLMTNGSDRMAMSIDSASSLCRRNVIRLPSGRQDGDDSLVVDVSSVSSGWPWRRSISDQIPSWRWI